MWRELYLGNQKLERKGWTLIRISDKTLKSVLIVNSEIYSAIINKLLYWKKIFLFKKMTLEKKKIQTVYFFS